MIKKDASGHWFDTETNRWVPNPNVARCKYNGCNRIARNTAGFCSHHTDWMRHAHGSSILTDADVVFLAENVDKLTDVEIADKVGGSRDKLAVLRAIRHHRRKYLSKRYSGKFYYKSIKLAYAKNHPRCEKCNWNEASCDVHHIRQEKEFTDDFKSHYHEEKNMVVLCPNHHRIFEELRHTNRKDYNKQMKKIKKG